MVNKKYITSLSYPTFYIFPWFSDVYIYILFFLLTLSLYLPDDNNDDIKKKSWKLKEREKSSDSLLAEHLWNILCVHTIHKTKQQWTFHLPINNGLKELPWTTHLWSHADWEQGFQLVWPTTLLLSNFSTAITSSEKG